MQRLLAMVLGTVLFAGALVAGPVTESAQASEGSGYAPRPDGFAVVSVGASVSPADGASFNAGEGPASAMTDGDPATKSGGFGPFDAIVDLGRVTDVAHVEIDFERYWDGPNVVQVSVDGTTWTDVVSSTGDDYMETAGADPNGPNTLGVALVSGTTARYVHVAARAWANVFEISISADASFETQPAGTQNLALGAAVTALNGTSFNLSEGVPENMVDGSGTTKSGGFATVDFMVDLGRVADVNYVRIDFQRYWDGPNRVSVSDDGASWTQVAVGTGAMYMNAPSVSTDDPNSLGVRLPDGTSGRYVRFEGRAWANIFEFGVFSSSAVPVESITFGATGGSAIVGVPTVLATTVAPTAASNQDLTWSVAPASTGGGSATIDPATGVLHPADPGTVVVTATAADGSGTSASRTIDIVSAARTWREIEIALVSSVNYANPFLAVTATATFTSAGGKTITRPAFWDGGDIWRVRFAPTEVGEWEVSITSSDPTNTGLALTGAAFDVDAYAGPLEVYRHGFPKVASAGKYFEYADGTPFYYLGDSHWTLREENWSGSNVEGIDSQFRYGVDHRASQGFTVFQSQPLAMNGQGIDVSSGVAATTLPALRDLDNKFAYVADAGLVHANAAWQFTSTLGVTDPATLTALGRYWSARYGAYPVLWTTAQEVDSDFYGQIDPQYWKQLAAGISNSDDYDHPLTAHMQTQTASLESGWGGEAFHEWYGLQTQTADRGLYEDAYTAAVDQPVITYETSYELNNTTTDAARRFAYRAFLSGSYGYGYGVQGVWATHQSPDEWFKYGPYFRWFDGLNSAGGKQMAHVSEFFESLAWWKLVPQFDGSTRSDFGGSPDVTLAVDGDETYVAYFASGSSQPPGHLRGMGASEYSARWFDPRTGEYTTIDASIEAEDGEWAVPATPSLDDWVLLVTDTPLDDFDVFAADGDTTITADGGTLQFEARTAGAALATPIWSAIDRDGSPSVVATVDAAGLVTAESNGVALICATLDGERKCRPIIVIRQGEAGPPLLATGISLEDAGNRQIIARFTPQDSYDQRVTWAVTETDGSPTTKAQISEVGVLSLREPGTVRVTATAMDGSNVSGTLDYDIVFNDVITNPLLEGAIATASSSDYANDYRPQKALTSNHGNFAGWTSATDRHVSGSAPEWIQVDLPEPREFNELTVYSTALGYQLRSYDVEVWQSGEWVTVGTRRNLTDSESTVVFAPVTTDRFRVVALEGDAIGIARVSALEPGYDPDAPVPPTATTPPTVTGVGTVGGTLVSSMGSWDRSDVDLTVQWYRDGEPISGATAAAYVVTAADQGCDLHAVVSATSGGLAGTAAGPNVHVRYQTHLTLTLSRPIATNSYPVVAKVRVTTAGAAMGREVTITVDSKPMTIVLDADGRGRLTLPTAGFGVRKVTASLPQDDDLEAATSTSLRYISIPL
ncbi:hypothetical protein GCM10009807_01430 [Microbacterium lacus]|uniref:F5/8 type C domain-containing protein n=2 Tax=Microbacterium lacus TaxID=415217 RepID=A0ABN2FX87_9MICO